MTPGDHKWPLITPNDLKIENWNCDFMYTYQMKVSNLGNLKIDMKYIFNLLVTSNDIKTYNWKTTTLYISNES